MSGELLPDGTGTAAIPELLGALDPVADWLSGFPADGLETFALVDEGGAVGFNLGIRPARIRIMLMETAHGVHLDWSVLVGRVRTGFSEALRWAMLTRSGSNLTPWLTLSSEAAGDLWLTGGGPLLPPDCHDITSRLDDLLKSSLWFAHAARNWFPQMIPGDFVWRGMRSAGRPPKSVRDEAFLLGQDYDGFSPQALNGRAIERCRAGLPVQVFVMQLASADARWEEVLLWAEAIQARAVAEGETETYRQVVAAHRVRAHLALGNYAECLARCNALLPDTAHRSRLDHAILSAMAGECLLRLGRPEEAAVVVPEEPAALNARACLVRWAIESVLGNEEEAARFRDHYREVVGSDPLAEEFVRSLSCGAAAQ